MQKPVVLNALYVVGTPHRSMPPALQALLELEGVRAAVRYKTKLTPSELLRGRSAALFLHSTVDDGAHRGRRSTCTSATLLVRGDQAIPTGWSGLLRSPLIRLVTIDQDVDGAYEQLATLLEGQEESLRLCVIASALERRVPALEAVGDILRCVLEEPWRIRRPRDLAASLGTDVAELRRRARRLGLSRVEHLITAIRFFAFEHLVVVERLPVTRALSIVGVADRSNFRKQCHRADYFLHKKLA
jgi:hypothetical protein